MNLPSKNLKIGGPQLSGLKEIFIVKGTVHYPEKSYLRKRFDSRTSAQNYVTELDRTYINSIGGGETRQTKISFEQEEEYHLAREILNQVESDRPISFVEAVSFYAQNYQVGGYKKIKLSEALEKYIEELNKRTVTKEYVKSTINRLRRFCDAWKGDKIYVSDFDHHDIKSWIRSEKGDKRTPWSFERGLRNKKGISQTERRNEWAALSGFFKFAYVDLEAIPTKIFEKVSPPPKDHPRPQAYTHEEARRIIESAAKYDELIKKSPARTGRKLPEGTVVVPYFALGLFSAIRPEEVRRLDWSDFAWNESGKVEVTINAKGKGGSTFRTITLPETCVEWIKPYRQDSGSVAPHYWIKNTQRVYAIAGYRAHRSVVTRNASSAWPELTELIGDPTAEDKGKPIHDGLRHTAVTFRLKVIEDDRKVGLWAGHSPQVQHSHYKALATEGQAQAFWKILPEGVDWRDVIKEKETREFLEKTF